jgi:hypothetical protein
MSRLSAARRLSPSDNRTISARDSAIIPARLDRRAGPRSDPFIAESQRSQARELVESGMLDRAAQITVFARELTDAAITAMEIECRACGSDVAALRSLRSAAFEGIALAVIGRLDRRRR